MASFLTKREELEATLSEAEATLADAVFYAIQVDANRVEADANLDKARANCRQVRTALVKLNHSDLMAGSYEQIDTQIALFRNVLKGEATARPPARHSNGYAVRGVDNGSQHESKLRRPFHRSNIGLSAQRPNPRYALASSLFARNVTYLLAVTSAYLLYFYIDVQLQIVRLPPPITWLAQ